MAKITRFQTSLASASLVFRVVVGLSTLFASLWLHASEVKSMTSVAKPVEQSSKVKSKKISGLMPVFLLLMEPERGIAVTNSDFSNDQHVVEDRFNINFSTFDSLGDTSDVCFVVSELSIAEQQKVSVSINAGPPQALSLGENCFTVVTVAGGALNNVVIISSLPNSSFILSGLSVEPHQQKALSLNSLTRSSWGTDQVRKVLKVFAFGGHARDSQIELWATMPPKLAIGEMLNFAEHNLKLSPLAPNEKYRHTESEYGTFKTFGDYLGSPELVLPMPLRNRMDYNHLEPRFMRMATMRGLNPFRQRIGLWETNYHLALNISSDVNGLQMVDYYDSIMAAHESGVPYHEVLGVAAKSAAVAMQYGHRRNVWIDETCFCNQDFSREIHQLYYGIFGETDGLDYHENITINNSASMLTGIEVIYDDRGVYTPEINLNPKTHHTGDLEILRTSISGNDAFEKVDNLMKVSIQHKESLKNLPIMIIEVLADDSLTETKRDELRAAWAAMGANKDFLSFIHAYAISAMFHSPEHFKYLNSFERALYTSNKFNLSTIETMYSGNLLNMGTQLETIFMEDDVSIFTPRHNVFGGQTSTEASDASVIFQKNYNRAIGYGGIVSCDTCDNGGPWLKDWTSVLPNDNGVFRTKDIASWLWTHFVGSTQHYGALEQAYLQSIVGVLHDLPLMMCIRADRIAKGQLDNSLDELISKRSIDTYCLPDSFVGGDAVYSEENKQRLNRQYSLEEIQSEPIKTLLEEIGNRTFDLNTVDADTRLYFNKRIHYGIGFILATPYMFAEGRGLVQ